MRENVAGWDRIARILIGLVLVALVFAGPKTAWGWIGVIPLATGALGRCPLYSVFGVATLRKPRA